METMQGKLASSQIDLWYTDIFCVSEVTSVFSGLVTVFLGTLWCSVKQIEAPYGFGWENRIALHAMQGKRDSSRGEGKSSQVFSSCGRNLCYILQLWWGCPFKSRVCSAKSGHLSMYDRQLRDVN